MIRRTETWLALVGLVLIVLGTWWVLAATPALLVIATAMVGLPVAWGLHLDAPSRTDAPGGYSVTPSSTDLAIQRYVSNPDAEVADLERDLDRTMRGIEPDPYEAVRDFLARAKAGA